MKSKIASILIICFIMMIHGFTLSAQSGSPLSESQIAKIATENQKVGKDPFSGVAAQFVISYVGELSDEKVNMCIADVKAIPTVIDIKIDPAAYEVKVTFPKQKDDPLFATIKETLAKYDVRIMKSEQFLYEIQK